MDSSIVLYAGEISSIERDEMAQVGKQTYERAADKIEGIGSNLDKIAGRDMLLHSFILDERPMRGDDKAFVTMSISDVDSPDEVIKYHAWSDSLAEKLAQLSPNYVPGEPLTLPFSYTLSEPLLVSFVRSPTASGFRVWTIE